VNVFDFSIHLIYNFLQKKELRKVIKGMVAQTLWCITFVHYLIEESKVLVGEEAQANY
jgi:hypothetical protein